MGLFNKNKEEKGKLNPIEKALLNFFREYPENSYTIVVLGKRLGIKDLRLVKAAKKTLLERHYIKVRVLSAFPNLTRYGLNK